MQIAHDSSLDPSFVADWAGRYVDAWNRGDGAALAALCTEDVTWTDPGLPAPVQGRGAVRGFVEATKRAFPDFRVAELEAPYVSAQEPRALSRYRLTATMRGVWEASNFAPTGRSLALQGVDEWTFRGELMCAYRSFYDSLDLARQLGVLPPAGSRTERSIARLQHIQAWFQRRGAAS